MTGQTMTIAQVAAHLGCSKDHVKRMIRDGRLEAFKLGERNAPIHVWTHSVQRLIERGRIKADAEPEARYFRVVETGEGDVFAVPLTA